MYTKINAQAVDPVSNPQIKQQQIPFHDGRNFFLEQKKTKQMMNTSFPLQRMIIVGMEESQVDRVIAADIAFQYEKVRGEIIKLSDLELATQDQYKIEPAEKVVITAHGEPGMIDKYPAATINELLHKIKNIEQAAFIFISSCDSATSDARTPSVVNTINLGPVNVYGSPGLAINDYSQITGDGRTVYKKDNEEIPYETMASLIEDTITKTHYPDVKTPLKADNWNDILTIGNNLHKEQRFRLFYDTLIAALSGKLGEQEVLLLIEEISETILTEIRNNTNLVNIFARLDSINGTPKEGDFLNKFNPEQKKYIDEMKVKHGSYKNTSQYFTVKLEKLKNILRNNLHKIWLNAKTSFVTQMPEKPLIDKTNKRQSYNEIVPPK